MADLLINKFGTGYGESSLTGFGDIRNADVYSNPGAVQINNKLQLSSQAPVTITFTADPATDLITFPSAHGLSQGAAITVSSTGTLPAPLVAGTIYYVLVFSPTTIKLASSLANAFLSLSIDITTAGTGTHTLTTVNMGRIRHFTDNPATNFVYCVDDNGRVWYVGDFGRLWALIDGNVRTNANGNGIVVFKNYLLVFRNNRIDTYGGPLGAGLTDLIANRVWTNNWQTTTNTSGSHHAIWALDDIAYFCNTRTVASIMEATPPFSPDTGGSFTYTPGALTLPSSYSSFRLEELGTNLMVAANTGVNNFNTTIFPWDRVSSSYDLPMKLPFQMDIFLTYNNVLYLVSTKMLRIYTTNGSYISELKRLPPSAFTFDSSGNAVVNGIGMYQGRINFTLSGRNNYAGLFSLNLQAGQYNSQGALIFDNITSTGSTATTMQVLGFFVPKEFGNLYVAWFNTATGTGGIDSLFGLSGSYVKYDNFETLIESPLIKVGNTLTKTNYCQIEIVLASPLVGGQAIRLSYRPNATVGYTSIGTFDTTNVFTNSKSSINTEFSFNDNIDIRGIEYLQVKCELDGGGNDTPQLLELRFRE